MPPKNVKLILRLTEQLSLILSMPPVLSQIRQNVFCQDCDARYLQHRRGWDLANNICQVCTERRQARLSRQRVVLRVPTGKLCSLCQQFLSEDHFHDAERNTYERCRECRKCELCSTCRKIKVLREHLHPGRSILPYNIA
jgi:hypothetical protein